MAVATEQLETLIDYPVGEPLSYLFAHRVFILLFVQVSQAL